MSKTTKHDSVPWWFEEEDLANADFREATMDWVGSLGLAVDRLAVRCAVVEHDGRHELHVDEVVRDADAKTDRWDPLTNGFLAIRRIVPVDEGSWPARPVASAEVTI